MSDHKITKCPPPPTYIRGGGSWIRRNPPIRTLDSAHVWCYPKHLKVMTDSVILEAVKKFPYQKQVVDFCKHIISGVTVHLCGEVAKGSVRNDLALSALKLLWEEH